MLLSQQQILLRLLSQVLLQVFNLFLKGLQLISLIIYALIHTIFFLSQWLLNFDKSFNFTFFDFHLFLLLIVKQLLILKITL